MFSLVACQQAPDLSMIEAERAKSLQRYDILQSLAANDKVIAAGTQSGVVLVSADQGKTWTRQALGATSLIGLATCPDGSFVGIDFNHRVWYGDAAGGGWQAVVLENPRTPLTVACDGKNQWWVAGSGAKIAMSADRGASWQVTDLGEDAQITALQWIDETFAIAVGEFGMVLTTEDGGATWQKEAGIPNEFYPYATLFMDRQSGYVSGIAGQIFKTEDGGKTWAKFDNLANASLYRLFIHDGKPYGVGASGIVARLDGDAFRAMPYPDALPVFLGAGISLPGEQAVVIGGPGGLVRVIGTQVN
ncbi:MAG: glycosyl hydrolase [Azonexus sp.]|nr:glycosyl hydrolase [Azonexus sp.]